MYIALGNKHDVLREKIREIAKISDKVLNFKTEAAERRKANEKQRYGEKAGRTDPGDSSHGMNMVNTVAPPAALSAKAIKSYQLRLM